MVLIKITSDEHIVKETRQLSKKLYPSCETSCFKRPSGFCLLVLTALFQVCDNIFIGFTPTALK